MASRFGQESFRVGSQTRITFTVPLWSRTATLTTPSLLSKAARFMLAAHYPRRLMIVEGADHNVAGFGGYGYIDKVSAFIRESLTTD